MNSTGFDMAGRVTPGTVIERVYFAIPVHGTIGDTFDTMADALVAVIEKGEASEARIDEFHARPVIDVRWLMAAPEGAPQAVGGSSDAVAERIRYESIADAQQHLTRLRHYGRA